uniref:Fanconi anemia group D2 protein, putative n=1 Tax=Ixodes scapularis TaxID=6945 RepID=A0A1S4KK89_IXOSC
MLTEDKELSLTILETLSNLNVDADMVSEIRSTVMGTLKSAELSQLPMIVRFVLSSVSSQEALQVVSQLRANLDFRTILPAALSSTQKTFRKSDCNGCSQLGFSECSMENDYELLTMTEIKNAVQLQLFLGDAWAKAVERVKVAADHKVRDQFSKLINKSRETNRTMRDGTTTWCGSFVRMSHVDESYAFRLHEGDIVVTSYSSTVLHLAQVLLWSPEPQVLKFGAHLYQHMFVCFEGSTRQEAVVNLVTHVGSGVQAQMNAALDCLVDLAHRHTVLMAPFGAFFKGMLDFLRNLSLCQIRTLFLVIALIAYQGGQQGAMFQDELHMMIRKMLTRFCPKSKRIGVVGALMTVKAMAASNLDQSASVSSATTPPETVKEAIELLELVRSSTSSSPRALALFYDELSRIVIRGGLDSRIETWIGDTIITDFQDDYVVDVTRGEKEPREPFQQELLFSLDDLPDGAIALNLCPLLLKEKNEVKGKRKHISLLTLSPLFRLLRVAEQMLNGETLEGIDALLGCPVRMPASSVCDSFHSLSAEHRQVVVASAFHCVNWFRELVNGFCGLRSEDPRAKVIDRIRRIVELQKGLEKWLQGVPGYIPPLSVFDIEDEDTKPPSVSQPPAKRGRKGKKRKVMSDDDDSDDEAGPSKKATSPAEAEDDADSSGEDLDSEVGKGSATSASWRPFLRELDLDVFEVLGVGLECGETEVRIFRSLPAPSSKLTTSELLFLLDDLWRKLDRALPSSAPKRFSAFKAKGSRDIGFSNLSLYPESDVAKFAVGIVPHLCSLLEDASAYFQHVISQNDGMVDAAGMFTVGAKEIASCMTLLLSCFNSLFSWNGFETAVGRDLLREAFRSISGRIGTTQLTQVHVFELGKRTFSYFAKFAESVTEPDGATSLLRLLCTVADRAELRASDVRDVRGVADGFLRRDWLCRPTPNAAPQRPRGSQFNESLQFMLSTFLSESECVLSSLHEIATDCLPNVLEDGTSEEAAGEQPKSFPTLDKSTLNAYYKTMFSNLTEAVRDLSMKVPSDQEVCEKLKHLEKWSLAITVFQKLVSVVKKSSVRNNLSVCLKFGRQFLESFLRNGMPLLDSLFKSQHGDVQGLLKNLQQSTRYLQHICSHSKVVKDVGLTGQVPAVRKTLELFVFRVKAMLTNNRCQDAFWVGNLKNRDLKGAEILSQTTAADSADEAQSDDARSGHES